MAEPELRCRRCKKIAPPDWMEKGSCDECLHSFEFEPPVGAPAAGESEDLTDDPSVERCPRPDCTGTLSGNECEMCQGIAFIDFEVPWSPQPIRLEFGERVIIGRDQGRFQDVLGNYLNISGVHCEISLQGRRCTVMDVGSSGTGSTNGTYVDGERLAPSTPRELKPGQSLRLGRNNPQRHLVAVELRVLDGA